MRRTTPAAPTIPELPDIPDSKAIEDSSFPMNWEVKFVLHLPAPRIPLPAPIKKHPAIDDRVLSISKSQIQIGYFLRMFFDELSSRFYFISHEDVEEMVGFDGIG